MPSCGFVLAGKAYDATWIREMIKAQDAGSVIPDRCGAMTRDGRLGAKSLPLGHCNADTALAFNWESHGYHVKATSRVLKTARDLSGV